MSDAIQQAIEAMEFAKHAVGPFHRVATKKLTESIEALQALQNSESEPTEEIDPVAEMWKTDIY
jgi:hypothetical protein